MKKTNNGFIKMNRNYDQSIHSNPYAFNLLAVIAQRAKRTESFGNRNLKFGEALLGDYKNYGMTRKKYRNILNMLKTANYVATRTTNRGTIAKLINTDIFDINVSGEGQQKGQQKGQTRAIKGPLTKNDKNEKKATGKKKDYSSNEECWQTLAPNLIRKKELVDPYVIALAKEAFITKSKSRSLSAVSAFLDQQIKTTPPNSNFVDFDLLAVNWEGVKHE